VILSAIFSGDFKKGINAKRNDGKKIKGKNEDSFPLCTDG
jgi:hypothetical protein